MRLLDELRSLVRGIVDRELRYSRLYPSAVAKVHSDGTFDVIPDDPSMRGNGHRVEVTHGCAGWVGDPEVGDRVLLGFDAADPSKPFAIGARKRTAARAVFDGGSKAVARVDDTVSLGWLVVTPGVPSVSVTSVAYAPPASTPPIVVPPVYLVALGPGVIASGNGKLLA